MQMEEKGIIVLAITIYRSLDSRHRLSRLIVGVNFWLDAKKMLVVAVL